VTEEATVADSAAAARWDEVVLPADLAVAVSGALAAADRAADLGVVGLAVPEADSVEVGLAVDSAGLLADLAADSVAAVDSVVLQAAMAATAAAVLVP
jgi:hypothetical protein